MAPRRVPKTKQNKLTGASSPRSSFLGGGMGALGGGLALGLGALSIAGLSSTLSNLGLPDLSDILGNPLYLGAAAFGLYVLLK
jgi:predicted lipid-binding transport protein (Tim44 family)